MYIVEDNLWDRRGKSKICSDALYNILHILRQKSLLRRKIIETVDNDTIN